MSLVQEEGVYPAGGVGGLDQDSQVFHGMRPCHMCQNFNPKLGHEFFYWIILQDFHNDHDHERTLKVPLKV